MFDKRTTLDGWAVTVALVVLMIGGVYFLVFDRGERHPQPTPTVTVTATPEPTPTYHGPVLLDEVAFQQGLPVEPIAHAVRTACAALDDGAEPVGVVLALQEDTAALGPRAADVAVEFGVRAYCPAHEAAVHEAAASLGGA